MAKKRYSADHSEVAGRVNKNERYLEIRVRDYSFADTLRKRLTWEEISIGFQCRFYREPDVYNFDFWDYFQNRLAPGEGANQA